MKKVTKASLTKRLRQFSAYWITDLENEPIVGSLDKIPELEFGLKKGWIASKYERREAGGRCLRYWYHFTPKGETEILQKMRETTCAFSGRRVN